MEAPPTTGPREGLQCSQGPVLSLTDVSYQVPLRVGASKTISAGASDSWDPRGLAAEPTMRNPVLPEWPGPTSRRESGKKKMDSMKTRRPGHTLSSYLPVATVASRGRMGTSRVWSTPAPGGTATWSFRQNPACAFSGELMTRQCTDSQQDRKDSASATGLLELCLSNVGQTPFLQISPVFRGKTI